MADCFATFQLPEGWTVLGEGGHLLDDESALATVSSSNHVGRRDFTPIALSESADGFSAQAVVIGGTIHAGILRGVHAGGPFPPS